MSRAGIVLFALSLCSASSVEAQLDRQPYLQIATPNSVIVAWRTTSTSDSVVCYGIDPNSLNQRATASAGRQHEVLLSGLNPRTKYFYAVGEGACPMTSDPSQHFTTSPMRGEKDAYRFWVVGDSGTGGTAQRNVRDSMVSWAGAKQPDLFLHVGDMAYSSGTDSEFTTKFYAIYEDVMNHTPTFPAMGNHEGYTSNSVDQTGAYYEGYVLPTAGEAGGSASGTEAYYSYDFGNVHFMVLDSHQIPNNAATFDTMMDWAARDLTENADQDWIVAYWHHPPYTKGSHDSDREGNLERVHEDILPILESHGVDLVLGGHSHIYERSYLIHGAYETPTVSAGKLVDDGDGRIAGEGAYNANGDGAVYIVAGHGGTGLRRSGTSPVMFVTEELHGSVLIDANGGAMTVQNLTVSGAVTDSFTMVKEEGLFLSQPVTGGNYGAGTTLDILWASVGDTTDVRIEWSFDGGNTWSDIVASTENDGSYEWLVPSIGTDRARVRISDAANLSRNSSSGDFSIGSEMQYDAISFGGTWEYLDDGSAPPADWKISTGGWTSGMGQFGYGDDDEATMLMDADPNIPAVLFRKAIEISGEVTAAQLTTLYDDAAAVWVNDTLVWMSSNLGGTDPTEFSDGSMPDNTIDVANLNTAAFVEGTNVVAAMVKQSSAGSSDLSFDLRLQLTTRVMLMTPPDAGVPDLGVDGSTPDASGNADASGTADADSTTDADNSEDASTADGGDGVVEGGCGCHVSGPKDGSFLGMLCMVWWLSRRRRTL